MYKKQLMEKRAELVDEMVAIRAAAESENRAFSEDEDKRFAEIEAEIGRIDNSLRAIDAARNLQAEPEETHVEERAQESEEDIEVRTFANIIRQRDDDNITKGENGAVIPKTIANRIIDRVKDISPLFGMAEHFNVKGQLSIPYVDEDSDAISVAYATEFVDLESKGEKLLTVDLTGYLVGVLSKMSISLINNTDLDLVNFVIEKMAMALATFIDGEILVGTQNKIEGLRGCTQFVAAGSTTSISADNLIDLKNSLKSVYQNGAIWVMKPETLTLCQKIKDGEGRYMFNSEIKDGFSGTILGKPVYTSDQAPALEANGFPITYINPRSALAVKMIENSVTILREKYATQHALGIVEWAELDCKVQNPQAAARLKMSLT